MKKGMDTNCTTLTLLKEKGRHLTAVKYLILEWIGGQARLDLNQRPPERHTEWELNNQ
jgi:hypothetical protein